MNVDSTNHYAQFDKTNFVLASNRESKNNILEGVLPA